MPNPELLRFFATMVEIISIQEIKADLRCKKTLTAKRWCKNNGVKIFRDPGSKTLYAIRAEYQMARMRQATAYLKEKYGDKFPEVLSAYLNFYSVYRQAVDGNSKTINKYKPKGKAELDFLKELDGDLHSFSK